MYDSKSEGSCEVRALGGNSVSVAVHQLGRGALGAGVLTVGDGGRARELSGLSARLCCDPKTALQINIY